VFEIHLTNVAKEFRVEETLYGLWEPSPIRDVFVALGAVAGLQMHSDAQGIHVKFVFDRQFSYRLIH
jgi:hypothetical protein